MATTPTDNFDFQNFYSATLTADITAGSLTISLDTVPTPSEGILVIDPDSATPECIFYTSKSVGTVTCPADGRGWDSTTAAAHLSGTTVIMAPTGYMFRYLKDGSLYDTTTTGWTNSGFTVSSVTNNGNRSYTVTYSADVSASVSVGQRHRFTRTVTAPTTSFSLDGSNDYYVKTSPSGITFTDDFVAGAWVYLTAYQLETVVSKRNGTQGWELYITSGGQVVLSGYNASLANYSRIVSYQSLPLNKWVYIAAQLDMSAFTATTTTSYIMIDGVDVPSSVSRSGTNPTALVQAGNLEIGSVNGGTSPFAGYIDQVFVSSAKITQANVQKIMTYGLTASDVSTYSLASAYSNGSTTDLNTTNANNLTATNGATTASVSPFATDGNGVAGGTYDYGLVTKVSTTDVTYQLPAGCTIPTSGGISSVVYGTSYAPLSFPVDRERWAVRYVINSSQDKTSGISATTYYNINGNNFTLPAGTWDISGTATGVVTHAGATYLAMTIALSSSSSTLNDARLAVSTNFFNTSLTENDLKYAGFRGFVSTSAATPMYVLNWTSQSTTTLLRTSFLDVACVPAGI